MDLIQADGRWVEPALDDSAAEMGESTAPVAPAYAQAAASGELEHSPGGASVTDARKSSDFLKYRAFLLFGAPGSGKGTQGTVLGRVPGYLHIATGELFRNLQVGSQLGRTFLEYSSKGDLVPGRFRRPALAGLCREAAAKPAVRP